MTDEEFRAALLAERYAITVPQHRHAAGPALWWQQHLAAEEAASTGRADRGRLVHRSVHSGTGEVADVG